MTDAASPTENEICEPMVAAILDHRLPPGMKLIKDRLATAFGVTRTRIRPVLVRLANEQVVTLTPNRGATVAQPTEREAREVFEVRRMKEPFLIEHFIAQALPADIATLTQCIANEEDARQSGDLHRAVQLSGDFHLYIASASGHQTLGRILRELVSRTSLILMAYSTSHTDEASQAATCCCLEHRSLLDAIRLRDAPEAARRMREQLIQLEAQLRFAPLAAATPDLLSLFGPSVAPPEFAS